MNERLKALFDSKLIKAADFMLIGILIFYIYFTIQLYGIFLLGLIPGLMIYVSIICYGVFILIAVKKGSSISDDNVKKTFQFFRIYFVINILAGTVAYALSTEVFLTLFCLLVGNGMTDFSAIVLQTICFLGLSVYSGGHLCYSISGKRLMKSADSISSGKWGKFFVVCCFAKAVGAVMFMITSFIHILKFHSEPIMLSLRENDFICYFGVLFVIAYNIVLAAAVLKCMKRENKI